jgi:hypothetical protein
MTGGRAPRAARATGLGDRTKRTLTRLRQYHGFDAHRVPLSGAARGRLPRLKYFRPFALPGRRTHSPTPPTPMRWRFAFHRQMNGG